MRSDVANTSLDRSAASGVHPGSKGNSNTNAFVTLLTQVQQPHVVRTHTSSTTRSVLNKPDA